MKNQFISIIIITIIIMLLTATFTDSHKTDIRDTEQKITESLLEKQNRENKEPTSQFYGLSVPVTYRTYDNLTNLAPDPIGFLAQNTSDFDYPQANVNLLWFNQVSLNSEVLDFKTLKEINLILNLNWFSRSSANSFPSNFDFDIYLNVYEITGLSFSNYIPVLQIKLANIIYDSATNDFTRLNQTIKLNLSDTVDSFDTNVSKITKDQYERLKSGQTRLSFLVGFNGQSLGSAQKQYMYNNRIFVNESSIILLYKGIRKL